MKAMLLPLLLWAGMATSAFAQSVPSADLIESAADALGGAEAVREVQSLRLEGAGSAWWLGQAPRPDALRELKVASFEQLYDFPHRRIRTTSHMPIYGVDVKVSLAADGEIAFGLNDEGAAYRVNNAPGAGRPPGYETPLTLRDEALTQKMAFYHHPLSLLNAALAKRGVHVTGQREDGGDHVLDMMTPAGVVTLRIDGVSRLPESIASAGYMGILGDVVIESKFADYGRTGAFLLPARIEQRIQDYHEYPAVDLRIASTAGQSVGDLAAPASVVAAEVPVLPAAVADATELASGVWRLAGNANHFSMLVEFPSYSVLVDAPVSDRRALAVIAKARELVAGKPLRFLVNTHHHFDHSGGVRAAVASGLVVITHELNVDFYNELVQRPHTARPDHLAANPAELHIRPVKAGGVVELAEGDRRLQIFPIEGSDHGQDLVMAYLPAEGILFQTDAYTAGADTGAEMPNLVRNIRERGLNPKLIVSGHGEAVPFQTLVDEAAHVPMDR